MKAGDAKGVPVQMKWLNASEVWKPAPRLKIDSPCSGTNAAVKTRPSTSDRPYAALEITIPPYECPTRIFGPEMPSSTARTIATSGETDRDYIDDSWRVRNLMKALRTHAVSPAASERVHDVCHRAVRSVDSDPHRDHFRGRRSFSGAA